MTSQHTITEPSYIDDADLNNDNIADLVIANFNESTISLFLPISNGIFGQRAKLFDWR
jgi:hypothetical protein